MDSQSLEVMQAHILIALSPTQYSCTHLEPLTGGTGNFTYRGHLVKPLESGAKTVIVKHAEGYLPSMPEFAIDVTRSDHEATLLHALSTPPTNLPPVSSPNNSLTISHTTLLHFDPDTHTQVHSDYISSLDLKSYLTTHSPSITPTQATELGRAIGIWLRNFHSWANDPSPSQVALRAEMAKNSGMGSLKHFVNYGRLVGGIAVVPDVLGGCEELFEDIEATLRGENEEYINGDRGELIHGDFWCGNILLADLPLPGEGGKNVVEKVVVIDWELAHLSTRAFDLGQLLAELYLLYHFRDIKAARWIMDSVLDGYGWEAQGKDREMAKRVALSMATHLVVWAPLIKGWSEGWDEREEGGDQGKMKECVEFGRDAIRHAWGEGGKGGDTEWFGEGVLERVFFDSE